MYYVDLYNAVNFFASKCQTQYRVNLLPKDPKYDTPLGHGGLEVPSSWCWSIIVVDVVIIVDYST